MPRRRGTRSIYNQSIPDNGYTYLTTRDGTQLAIDVHPPTQSGGRARRAVELSLPGLPTGRADAELHAAVSDADRVLGLRLREPGRPGKRHRRARQPDGLRRGRREHARHRLLGRRLRLLRTAAEPRRLRRDRDDRPPAVGARPQGRDARHLLRRDQPAVRRAAAAAGPRGDRAAVGDRRDGDDALPRRHPQHRLRGGVGRSSASRTPNRPAPTSGAALGLRTDPGRRSDLRGQPGPARRGGEPAGRRSKKTRPTTRRWPTRSTRSRSCTTSTCRRSWPASGRTSRPAGTAPIWREHFTGTERKWFTFTNGAHVDSLDPYTFDRLYDFLELYVAHQAPIDNAAVVHAAAPIIYQAAMGLPKDDIVTLPPDPIQEKPTYESALSAFDSAPGDPGAVRQRRGNLADRQHDGRRSLPGVRTVVLGVPDPRHDGSTRGISGRTARSTNSRPTAEGVDSYTSDANATPLTDYSANTGPGGLWGNASAVGMELGAAPGRLRRVLRVGAAHAATPPRSAGAPSTSGSSHPLRTSISRRRSARCAPTATRPSSRTAGSGRASASSPPPRNNMFKQSPDAAPADPDLPRIRCAADARRRIRPGHDPAVLRGARLPRGLAHQGHDLRAERHAAGVVVQPDAAGRHHRRRSRSRSGPACRRASPSRSCPASTCPRGCPPCPSLRNEPCRPYQAFVNDGS